MYGLGPAPACSNGETDRTCDAAANVCTHTFAAAGVADDDDKDEDDDDASV